VPTKGNGLHFKKGEKIPIDRERPPLTEWEISGRKRLIFRKRGRQRCLEGDAITKGKNLRKGEEQSLVWGS